MRSGRFTAVHLVRGGAVLEYTVRGARVREWMTVAESNGRSAIVRNLEVAAAAEPLWLMLGFKSTAGSMSLCRGTQAGLALESIPTGSAADAPAWAVKIPSHTEPVQLCVAMSDGALAENVAFQAIPAGAAAQRWPQKVTTTVTRSAAKDAYVVDDFALPVANPWRRNVRPGDIQFFRDGTGVSVTLDGDVWLVRGLQLPNGPVTWTRFASGLHEPMSRRDPRRRAPCLRPQRHLAPARHKW